MLSASIQMKRLANILKLIWKGIEYFSFKPGIPTVRHHVFLSTHYESIAKKSSQSYRGGATVK